MTAMPQMVALFNGVGGGAVFLIAWSSSASPAAIARTPTYVAIFSVFAAIVGSVSFWGSNIAFGKLQEILPGRPITLRLGAADRQPRAADRWRSPPACDLDRRRALRSCCSSACCVCAALLGNAVVLPIGGADMPVVISLLNAFTGLSAAATGIALEQPRADRRRHDRRRVGLDPHEPDGGRDEPLDPGDHRRRLRRRRRGRGRERRRRARGHRALDERRRRRDPARLRAAAS